MDVRFFASPADFRAWLEENHATASELLVGFHKRASGKGGITYSEALDQALCFGWIDGVRKRLDDVRYTIRFTPRKRGSVWSLANIKRAKGLQRLKLMAPAGLEAFKLRDERKAESYSYERRSVELGDPLEERFKTNPAAWQYFRSQPPGYRKVATWWVVSAKREETKLRRLEILIQHSEESRRLPMLTSPAAGTNVEIRDWRS